MYGDNAIGESTTRKWFSRFKEDHFNISDTPRSGRTPGSGEDHFGISDTPHSGRPSGFVEDRLSTLIHSDPCQCTQELADVMNCGQHLYSMNKVRKSGVRVSHALS